MRIVLYFVLFLFFIWLYFSPSKKERKKKLETFFMGVYIERRDGGGDGRDRIENSCSSSSFLPSFAVGVVTHIYLYIQPREQLRLWVPPLPAMCYILLCRLLGYMFLSIAHCSEPSSPVYVISRFFFFFFHGKSGRNDILLFHDISTRCWKAARLNSLATC